jgi:hypothetical protein
LTSDLVSQKYKDFWKKITHNSTIESKICRDFLNGVGQEFENFTKETLFGMDFVYDYQINEYYLIDLNQYPGYKEINKEFNTWLIDHIILHYNDHKQNLI